MLPPDYVSLSPADKLKVLWKNITETEYSNNELPTTDPDKQTSLGLMVPQFTHVTFAHVSDEFPEGRPKVIHTFGSVAKIEMRLAPTAGAKARFSGMFSSNSVGLARISLGRHQIASFSPGVAIKLLIDGHSSRNMVALNSFDGQNADRNVFRLPFTNILPAPTSTAQKIVNGAFTVSAATLHPVEGDPFDKIVSLNPADKPEGPRNMPLLDAAKINPDGSAADPVTEPYQIFFTPNPEVTKLYEPKMAEDYRVALKEAVPAGTVLWDVSAKATKDEHDPPVLIGQVVTTSRFVASKYGDATLFFQHMQHHRV